MRGGEPGESGTDAVRSSTVVAARDGEQGE